MNWFLKVLKQYADFNGRARRKEYWMFTLFFMIIYYSIAAIGGVLGSSAVIMIALVFALGVLVPSIAVGVRRLHDTGKSGWYLLLGIVPVANFYILYLLVIDSTPGPNEYGDNPKDIGNEGVDQITGV